MRYILDTNICVHWLHDKGGVAQKIASVGLENCCISEITKAELLYGEKLAESKGIITNHQLLLSLFKHVTVVPISYGLEVYAEQKVRLRSLGLPIEDYDLLIGSTAVAIGMVLITENEKHMSRIAGIRIENWMHRE